MNRYEWIVTMSREKMAKVLCRMNRCGKCPADEYCHTNHNGFYDYLGEVVEEPEDFDKLLDASTEPIEK